MRLMNCRYVCSSGGHDKSLYPEASTLECLWNQGFYSNMSQTFGSLIILLRHGIIPDRISYEHGFIHFKTEPGEDIFPHFHLPAKADVKAPASINIHIPHSNKTRGELGKYQFEHYNSVIEKYFSPSSAVLEKQRKLQEKYQIDPAKTIAILYRGTDKKTEVDLANPDQYLEVVKRILKAHPDFRVLIQTDEGEVMRYWKAQLGECSFSFDETPTTDENRVIWSLMARDQKSNILEWSQWFDAALRTIAGCQFVINHTGNVGLFLNLYRGHLNGVHQFDEFGALITDD